VFPDRRRRRGRVPRAYGRTTPSTVKAQGSEDVQRHGVFLLGRSGGSVDVGEFAGDLDMVRERR
jgi:hypothetical protein